MGASCVVAFVGFPADLVSKCRESLESNAFRLVEEPSVAAALAGVATRRSDLAKPDVFALGPAERSANLAAVREIRAHPLVGKAGIIVVDARLAPDDAAALLDVGADDCYQRPFLPAIFCARARTVARRGPRAEDKVEAPGLLRVGPGLSVQLIERRVTVDQTPVALSRGQFDLVAHLARNAGRPVPAPELIAVLARHLLYVSAARLRQELEEVRSRLGRVSELLELRPDGGARLALPQAAGQ